MPTLTHLADTHLGHRQYGLVQREDDTLSTLRATIDDMLAHEPRAILLPGDLFHSRDLRPKILHRAERELDRVPDDVPVVVSRGNHDENLTPREVTWLNYLHRRGTICFLRADLEGETARFAPYDPAEPGDHAGFVDIDGEAGPIRVFGLQWRGAKTDRALEQVGRGIRATNEEYGTPEQTILLAHFGIEEEVPDLGGAVTHADLEPIRDVVDYLALGHIHKRYDAGGWIYNPGSPEAHSTREARDEFDHGYYELTVGEEIGVEHHPTKRRPYARLAFDVTEFDSPGDLETAFREHVRSERSDIERRCTAPRFTASGEPRAPIVDLRFTGTLQFDRGAFRPDDLAAWVEETLGALYVQVNSGVRSASVDDLVAELDAPVFEDGRLNTDALEQRVFETIARESPYDAEAEAVADTLETAHRMAQAGEDTADLRETVTRARRELFPDREQSVALDIEEDPFGEADGTKSDGRESDGSEGDGSEGDGGETDREATEAAGETDREATEAGGDGPTLSDWAGDDR